MNSEAYLELWAKDSGETMLTHSLNVVRIAQLGCANLPFPPAERNEMTRILMQLAAFHDLGKCAIGFQSALRQQRSWGHRHEILSTALAAQLNPQLEGPGLLAIITHHRSIPADHTTEHERCLPDDELPFDDSPTWDAMVKELRDNEEGLTVLLDELGQHTGLILTSVSLAKLDTLGLPEAWLRRGFQLRRVESSQRRRASLLRGLLVTSDHLASSGNKRVPQVPQLAEF